MLRKNSRQFFFQILSNIFTLRLLIGDAHFKESLMERKMNVNDPRKDEKMGPYEIDVIGKKAD